MNTRETYDALPYLTSARRTTHPDTLAVAGRLAGLTMTPIERSRVLEVGCGTGGNLIPIAATMPNAELIGIDLSPVQIEMAQQSARDLGLSNIRFEAEDLTQLSPALGQFDYIIAHGVYSWVPPAVQEGLLRMCGERLTPSGAAFISYNTYPGWQFREIARKAMSHHVRDLTDPRAMARAGRDYMRFLAQAIPEQNTLYARAVQDEFENLDKASDFYIFHEFLETNNQPQMFREFARRAAEHGLRYIGEVPPSTGLSKLPPETVQALRSATEDPIELEQYVDFLVNRAFRRSILCRAEATPRPISPGELPSDLLLLSGARPRSEKFDIESEQTFESGDGRELTTKNPVVLAALGKLYEVRPRAMGVADLEAFVAEQLGAVWSNEPERARLVFQSVLMELQQIGMVVFCTWLPNFVTEVSDRPVAFAPARCFTVGRDQVPTLLQSEVRLAPIDRVLLP